RWLRVIATLDAYFARSSSSPEADGALTDLPLSLLLPALQFFCGDEEGIAARCCCCNQCLGFPSSSSSSSSSEGKECWQRSSKVWRDCLYRVLPRHDLHNDLCEILVSKSLGCFCLRSSREQEIANQLRAYKATLLTSLEQMQAAAAALQQLQHEMQLLQLQHRHHLRVAQHLQERLQKQQQPQQQLQQQLQEAEAAAAETAEKMHEATEQSKQHERDFAGHTQRCELYVSFLGDLLLCHPSMLRREIAKQHVQQQQQHCEEQQQEPQQGEAGAAAAAAATGECLLDLLWRIVTAAEAATKRLQSFALRVLMKLLLLGLVQQQQLQKEQQQRHDQQQQQQQDMEQTQAVLASRFEVLLEALYLQPVLQHQYREHEKYVSLLLAAAPSSS
ncbi:hypothetical protein, conserved, partial [Eimeria tenella]